MKIVENGMGEITLRLNPGDCLLLADACRHAADDCAVEQAWRNPDASRAAANRYFRLACTFEGYALVADAGNHMLNAEAEAWTLETIRREYGGTPHDE